MIVNFHDHHSVHRDHHINDRMHENLALDQPVEELDNLEKHARNLVKGRLVCMLTMMMMMMMMMTGVSLGTWVNSDKFEFHELD